MPDQQETIPPVFFAHGAPTLAVRDTPASRFLKGFSKSTPRPRFILILSAHWETPDLKMSAPGPLRTYHDFGGFSPDLYEITYPAFAEPNAVAEVMNTLVGAGLFAKLDDDHGLDHGAWVPLSLAYPDADIPVVQVSLPFNSTSKTVHDLGKAFASLAKTGVLIVGSGSTIHNLRAIGPDRGRAPDWAIRFDAWLEKGLESGSITYFEDLETIPDFRQSHPTEEHLLPLFFPFGAAGSGAKPELMHRSYEYGSISMSYFRFA
ncbi:DODA-type extradiol aromatic ring-opening family dioxygenase [Roseibium sp.]|uniref:DODA-type extradiol aromatic ring-opening family dioxygenase n=1 Tax=Roseibium sp. TaxID=1936156 RepID=UPI003B52BF3E